MKIDNITIKDFRNISQADVKFGNINVITGYNSSGKSNFLLALYYSLSLQQDYSKIFNDNIVTFQKGKDRAILKVRIIDDQVSILYSGGEAKSFIFIHPESFEFKKIIDKKTSASKSHELIFTGIYEKISTIDFRNITSDLMQELHKKYTIKKNIKVFYEDFTPTLIDNKTKLIKQQSDVELDKDKFINIFKNYSSRIKFWISDKSITSNLIYQYVTEIPTNETYEQIVKYIKNKNDNTRSIRNFENSKFIFLIADIQKDALIYKKFKKELNLYTQGIVTDLSITTDGGFSNKGEINVQSPKGPKDIYSISTGTSVILFLVAFKNWLSISNQNKYYEAPTVMIFDELEANIHPSLINELTELLRVISKKVQLFLSTHSPKFIDFFYKNELYLIKDTANILNNKKGKNRCNIYDYESIIKHLPEVKREEYMSRKNSELFVDGMIDKLFPL